MNFLTPTAEASRSASDRYAALCALAQVDPTAPLQTVFDAVSAIIVEAVGADALDIFLYDASSESLIAVRSPRSPMARMGRAVGIARPPPPVGGGRWCPPPCRSGMGAWRSRYSRMAAVSAPGTAIQSPMSARTSPPRWK